MSKELKVLTKEYKKILIKAADLSKKIEAELFKIYTPEKMKEFKTCRDFLEDVNFLCETDSTGKLIFIRTIRQKYFD